jgi:hypothetical protein
MAGFTRPLPYVLTPQAFSTSHLVLGPVLSRSGIHIIAQQPDDGYALAWVFVLGPPGRATRQ